MKNGMVHRAPKSLDCSPWDLLRMLCQYQAVLRGGVKIDYSTSAGNLAIDVVTTHLES
jgi:hypothetical protein